MQEFCVAAALGRAGDESFAGRRLARAKTGFTLELTKKEEIKKAVEAETAVYRETSLMISDASKEKGDEILNADIDSFQDRKELTKAIEEFGADVVKKSADKNSIMKTRIGELSRAGGESGAVANG